MTAIRISRSLIPMSLVGDVVVVTAGRVVVTSWLVVVVRGTTTWVEPGVIVGNVTSGPFVAGGTDEGLAAAVVSVVTGDDELLVEPSMRIDSLLVSPEDASTAIPAPMKTARPATMASTVSCCLFTRTSLTLTHAVSVSRFVQQTPGARSAA